MLDQEVPFSSEAFLFVGVICVIGPWAAGPLTYLPLGFCFLLSGPWPTWVLVVDIASMVDFWRESLHVSSSSRGLIPLLPPQSPFSNICVLVDDLVWVAFYFMPSYSSLSHPLYFFGSSKEKDSEILEKFVEFGSQFPMSWSSVQMSCPTCYSWPLGWSIVFSSSLGALWSIDYNSSGRIFLQSWAPLDDPKLEVVLCLSCSALSHGSNW